MSTMDMYWHDSLTLDEGIALVKKCMQELKVRFIGNLPDFVVKVVDAQGVREISVSL